MKKDGKSLKKLCLMCALLVPGISAQAVLLPSGSIVQPTVQPIPGPSPAVASLVSPYNVVDAGGALAGTLTSWVVSGDTSNPFGGLSFYYQVANNGLGGTDAIGGFTVSDFTGWALDTEMITVGWDGAITGGVAPAFVDRSVVGDVVGFDFLGGSQIPAGSWSELMVLHTSATEWNTALGSVINHNSQNLSVLAPVPIPEPETYAMLLAGLGVLGLLARRRKKD